MRAVREVSAETTAISSIPVAATHVVLVIAIAITRPLVHVTSSFAFLIRTEFRILHAKPKTHANA